MQDIDKENVGLQSTPLLGIGILRAPKPAATQCHREVPSLNETRNLISRAWQVSPLFMHTHGYHRRNQNW